MSSDPQTGLGRFSVDALAAPFFDALVALAASDSLAAFASLSVAEAFFPFEESSSPSGWVRGDIDGVDKIGAVVWPSFKSTSSAEGLVVDQPSTLRCTS